MEKALLEHLAAVREQLIFSFCNLQHSEACKGPDNLINIHRMMFPIGQICRQYRGYLSIPSINQYSSGIVK